MYKTICMVLRKNLQNASNAFILELAKVAKISHLLIDFNFHLTHTVKIIEYLRKNAYLFNPETICPLLANVFTISTFFVDI